MLRSKQREQLHAALLEYLHRQFPDVAAHFQQAAGISIGAVEISGDILEAKWTAALRLQRRISDLEKENAELKSKIALFVKATKYNTQAEGLPQEPFKETLKGHRKPVTSVLFHPIFQLLITASEDGTVKIWNYEKEDGYLERSLNDHTDSVNNLDLDESGKWLASASSDLLIIIWDFTTYECVRTLAGHDAAVSGVKFVFSGEKLFSCSKDKTVKLWDTQSGYCLRTFTSHTEWVRSIAVPPIANTKLFASAGSDKRICIWSMEEAECIQEIAGHDHVVEHILFAPVNTLTHLIERRCAPPPLPLHLRYTKEGMKDSSFQNSILDTSGPVLFSASRDRSIKMWDAVFGHCLGSFIGHDNWVRHIAVHPTGYYLLSCSDDKTIRIWEIISGLCFNLGAYQTLGCEGTLKYV
ncbi:WD domain, G-beta repeat-containing protein [Cardiosporidium cionae]|uniref:WD domain, G-beta repeat-containing protein n=1 Tax=Cardiosporidium cionae TaxID=476202 RepID=A0ABQ7J6C3_9APIC|nr:WD domain, G-beta repeat-containing protein [Cardiosporidium cionae]|eukprot:KAF8819542.1 WD domain, G-beta repeat-containing protein [Cardiosporidium cionae]